MTHAAKLGTVQGYDIWLHHHLDALKEDWYHLQSEEYCSIYQHYDWVRIASETVNKNDTLFVLVARQTDTDETAFIWPMVLKHGKVNQLVWTGGSHSNVNAPVFAEGFIETGNHQIFADILKLAGKSINGPTITKLGNQPLKINGHNNPLLALTRRRSVNTMFVMDLSDGLDGVLDAGNGKRKRKAFRKQERVAESMGGYEMVIPETQDEIIKAIEEFREFKKIRFKQMGIKDVFADTDTIDLLNKLACEPAYNNHQLFRIIQLKVGGITRALYAGGVVRNYYQASINGISIDDFTNNSPGEFLLYLMVDHLCQEGFTKMDLGVGSERYKHSWCQHEYELFDVVLPLSNAAKPLVLAITLKDSIKTYLRNNQTIWNTIKKLRRLKGKIKS